MNYSVRMPVFHTRAAILGFLDLFPVATILFWSFDVAVGTIVLLGVTLFIDIGLEIEVAKETKHDDHIGHE